MMKRRIIINLLLAFIVVPIIKLSVDFVRIELLHDYSSFSGSFLEYEKLIATTVLIGMPLVSLVFILLPYNLIILSLAKKRRIKLLHKVFIFGAVLILFIFFVGTFLNVLLFPYVKNLLYIAYIIPMSFIFASLLHFMVDKNDPSMKFPESEMNE